jgi:uncharacterized short protein YbdD (DUF466 family)
VRATSDIGYQQAPAPIAAQHTIDRSSWAGRVARYVADWNARHPEGGAAATHGGGHRLLTEREFFDERLRIKYGGGV